ncbi:hypothetical protein GWK08_05965 [Leptobacterium flavescens]|uniref:Peptidase S74 domain-containing protein n=1 Tax=Leptobacterium flavescens TaxID=472055 RepID=A0A6P0URH7_9FLAO|nr:hypothetical protein [Leptobacterium flavescens]NER12976.1 hypothetical protein [Leptobacterium flavescens]
MKKIIFTILLAGASIGLNAQNTFPASGNVGIGTTNTSNGILTVNGDSSINLLRLENDGYGNEASLRLRSKSSSGGTLHSDISLFASGTNQGYLGFKVPHNNGVNTGYDMIINHEGKVGIGTTNPDEKLDVNGSIKMLSGAYGAAYFKYSYSTGNTNSRSWIMANDFYDWGDFGIYQSPNQTSSDLQQYIQNYRFYINRDGDIGIGTVTPNGWKLAVNGKIRAKEIKVDTGWSDFVFEKDYDLPTLTEVEEHIKEKGHLKDIPSAKEVAENGILLGEMDSKLLQKIEELTLYTINQEKRIKELEKTNKKLLQVLEKLVNEK